MIKLVAKVNNIDTREIVLKDECETDQSDFEKKIRDADKKISDTRGPVKRNRL